MSRGFNAHARENWPWYVRNYSQARYIYDKKNVYPEFYHYNSNARYKDFKPIYGPMIYCISKMYQHGRYIELTIKSYIVHSNIYICS